MDSPTKAFISRKKAAKGGPLIMSLMTMGVVLLSGTLVTVLVPTLEPEPEFIAKKTIYLPQRELEHQMQVSEFQQAAASPTSVEKLSIENILSDTPPLPRMPIAEFTPIEDENPLSQSQSMFDTSGLMGALQGLQAEASSVSFLGIEDDANKIVIVFDISKSVITKIQKAGMSILDVKTKTIELIHKLNANTMFALIQHSRNHDSFLPHMIVATVDNKQAAIDWINKKFRTDGRSGSGWTKGSPNGIQSVIKAAFAMEPDVIFLLADASYQRNTPSGGSQNVPWDELTDDIEDLQKQLPKPARIHFIGFGVHPNDKDEMRKIIRKNNGKYKAF